MRKTRRNWRSSKCRAWRPWARCSLTTQKDGVIASKFHYADNQVDLNGNKMSLQEFIGQFAMLGAPAEDAEPAQEAEPAPAPAQ